MKLKKFNFKKVNNTNNLAINIIKNSNYKAGIILAQIQKNGRGQYGKKWISYKGNLFTSIFFSIDKINLSLHQLTKINCYIVKKILSNFYKGKITIKKPNDLLINKKKISGILQETVSKSGEKFIIIGIGINLIKSPKIKKYPTTNLLEITGIKVDYQRITSLLRDVYEKFIPLSQNFNIKQLDKI